MKVAILSESSADEAAIKILVDGILGFETELIAKPPIRTRGYPSVVNLIPMVFKHFHYRTQVDALIIVIDSDDSAIHNPSHEQSTDDAEDCRLCSVSRCIERVRGDLTAIPNRSEINVAIGIAYPCMEAWYGCGLDASISENSWERELQNPSGLRHKRLQLKQKIYNTERPSLSLETQRAKEECNRLINNLEQLERLFPVGFGSFANEIRGWDQ